jgi:hypothetical protein
VGYDRESKGHLIYWPEHLKISVERSVIFSRAKLPIIEDLPGAVDNLLEEEDSDNESNGVPKAVVKSIPEVVVQPVNPTLPEVRHSECQKEPSRYVRDLLSRDFTTGLDDKFPKGLQLPMIEEDISGLAMSVKMDEASGLVPTSLNEAMKSPDWPRWKEVMEEERDTLEAHRTWKVVDTPKNSNIVGCRWVFAVKHDAAGNII